MHTRTDMFITSDGLRLASVAWLPDGDPHALIILLHGVGEHAARYAHVGSALAEAGYAVHAVDHRTHGKSQGKPRCYFADFKQPLNDIKQFVAQVKADCPGHPVFMMGHSMGSLLALLYALDHQDSLDGLISEGTPLTVDSLMPRPVTEIGKLAKRVIPTVPAIPLDVNALSRDTAVVQAYKDDPLVYHQPLRVKMAVDIAAYGVYVRERANRLRLPLLVLHGKADRVSPVSGSQHLYDRAASPDKTLHIYDDAYHEIHNEPDKEQFLTDITDWLAARTS